MVETALCSSYGRDLGDSLVVALMPLCGMGGEPFGRPPRHHHQGSIRIRYHTSRAFREGMGR